MDVSSVYIYNIYICITLVYNIRPCLTGKLIGALQNDFDPWNTRITESIGSLIVKEVARNGDLIVRNAD